MTSKEKLQRSINSLTYKESQYGLKKYEKERLECYKDVVKDLSTKDALLKFAIPFLATFTDMDGKIHICNYHTYVEELKRITIMKPISEEDFNLIKEAWENEL